MKTNLFIWSNPKSMPEDKKNYVSEWGNQFAECEKWPKARLAKQVKMLAEMVEILRKDNDAIDAMRLRDAANLNYYRRQLDAIGRIIGLPAYLADDNTLSDSVLIDKLPELIAYKIHGIVIKKAE